MTFSASPIFKLEYKYFIVRKKKSLLQSSQRNEKQNRVLEVRLQSSNKEQIITRYDVFNNNTQSREEVKLYNPKPRFHCYFYISYTNRRDNVNLEALRSENAHLFETIENVKRSRIEQLKEQESISYEEHKQIEAVNTTSKQVRYCIICT